MEWLSAIGGVATSAASGGLFGFLGAAVGGITKYFAVKAEREFQKEKWKHEKELFDQEMERSKVEQEQRVELVAQEGSWDGLQSTVDHDTALTKNSPSWVNAIKSLFRPVLTMVLNIMQFVIFWHIWQGFVNDQDNAVMSILNAPESTATGMLKYVIYSIVFSAQTSTVWWFGERAFTPPGMKNK